MKKKSFHGLLLRTFIIGASFVLFFVHTNWLWVVVALQFAVAVYFLMTDRDSFVHTIFWPIFLASMIILPWPWAFILPILVYLLIVLPVPEFRKRINWLKTGSIDKKTLLIMIPTILVSSVALIAWYILAKPDISDLKSMVPSGSVALLLVIGLLFSVFNSLWEEIILKGILWNDMEDVFGNTLILILFQGILFGVMHWNGFPRGVTGAVLAGIYGILIGFIRKSSKGLLAPVVTHFFADAVIFGILISTKI